ncbi:CaiB/BaiF CoA transferase family protein [Bordetella bronchiseptica]|uniref:Subunit of succinyl-CoA:benzylsuccinate CoA-transferase n=2 Tax=Bordetella bronchiseptica TaxID=518 RepID=A0A0H3LZB4_BORBR|nr:CoA transferase [Bordetella bronchiseptica]KAK61077.1 CoA-transferase family III protein [Bordetella bronchiseptica 980-2]KDD57924.1 CoA-transferase family III protein [Bordetella bronchiseptica OSU553]AMG90318.1 CoA transferase [Bordetella bronchiseptica]AWP86475.1 succinyl-CoA--benzylsuccinate CoA-transferase [Bordetella bronchiseptica]AWQ12046.1 succinyl-CoA--benzylsuccinate CoA-transferase [Bordetella bronchiseptica]
MKKLPLYDVRIADFTWLGAGSFTTKIFADMGAEVIKVESAKRPDALRHSPPYKDRQPGANRSGYFSDRNSSKRSVTLNLKTEAGLAVARELIACSDVVANNFSAGVMDKLGLGYESVRAIKPDIVYLSMSMLGQTGPQAHYLGYGLTIGALTGLHGLAGLPGRDPTGTGTNYSDHIPNPTHAALAVMAALRHRRRTGQGQFIDLSQIEPTACLLGPVIADYTANGTLPEPMGNRHRPCAPYGVFPCTGEDRWIAIAVQTDEQWRRLAHALPDGPLRAARWETAANRLADAAALEQALGDITRGRDRDDLMRHLQQAGVPAGAVLDARDVLSDPQLTHREHWVPHEHAEMGLTTYSALPFRFSDVPVRPRAAAPLLGEHTHTVLRDILRKSTDDIQALQGAGALE